MRQPIAIDLFCGAGGLTEGLRQAGYKVIGGVELDPLACNAYRLNHKQVKVWEDDIRGLTGTTLMKALHLKSGELDLLAACPPCQGFSTMRTKNGTRFNRDPRNRLILDVLRIARSIRPKSIMIENVPGFIKSRSYIIFCEGLRRLGYHVTWDILNAVDYGVPQRRRRLVLLASKNNTPEFAPKAAKHRTVREFIGHLVPPERSSDPLHNYKIRRSKKVKKIIEMIPLNGGNRTALRRKDQLPCHKRSDGFKDVYGRMAWDKPAPTITGGCINPSKGRFLHPNAHRAITLREAALLQTFPKTYRFPLERGRYPAALLIGNALPPEFIRRIATALKNHQRYHEVIAPQNPRKQRIQNNNGRP